MLKMPRRKTRRGRQQTRKGQHLFLTGDKSLKEASAMIPTTKGHHPLSAQSLTRLRRVTKRESEYLAIYLFRHMVYMLPPPLELLFAVQISKLSKVAFHFDRTEQ